MDSDNSYFGSPTCWNETLKIVAFKSENLLLIDVEQSGLIDHEMNGS